MKKFLLTIAVVASLMGICRADHQRVKIRPGTYYRPGTVIVVYPNGIMTINGAIFGHLTRLR